MTPAPVLRLVRPPAEPVEPDEEPRDTALGDARWARAVYEAVLA